MANKPTFCTKCRSDFRRPYNLTLHKKVAHSKMVSKVICPICVEKGSKNPQKCSNISNLRKHIEREHANHRGKKTIRNNKFNGKKLEYPFYEKSKLRNGRVLDPDDSEDIESSSEFSRNSSESSERSLEEKRVTRRSRTIYASDSSENQLTQSDDNDEDGSIASIDSSHAAREIASHQLNQLRDSTQSDDNDDDSIIESSYTAQEIVTHQPHLLNQSTEMCDDTSVKDENPTIDNTGSEFNEFDGMYQYDIVHEPEVVIELNDTVSTAGEVLVTVQTQPIHHTIWRRDCMPTAPADPAMSRQVQEYDVYTYSGYRNSRKRRANDQANQALE